MTAIRNQRRSLATLGMFSDQSDEGAETLVIPEDLSTLSNEELADLTGQARETFNALYNGGDVRADDLETLESLTEGIEALGAEQGRRDEAAAEARSAAEALAKRALPSDQAEDSEAVESNESDADDTAESDVDDDAEGDEGESAEAEADAEEKELVTAGATPARREVRVNLSGLSSRQSASAPRAVDHDNPQTMRDVVMAAPDVPGFSNGQGMDFLDLGRAVNTRLTSFNESTYKRAAASGRHLRQQFGIATIRKPFADELRLDSADPEAVERVFAKAADETRLPGGSLVASGGWCAPSEVLYDLYEVESRDGLFSVPEVAVSRGGIKFTTGPDFATLFAQINGFYYTEEQDIEGEYGVDADGVGNDTEGDKPCYRIDCPDWDEVRLALEGLCLTAGLLQRRGFPEYIARIIRGALVAHDHRVAGRKIASIVAGSTAVSMPAGQVGTLAPLLTAIELQVEHYKEVHRLPRSTSLEAVFPFWVRGAIRSDLSRRLGVDMIDVPDSRINAWFTSRGVNPQFVYNWQGVSAGTAAADFTAWPSEVDFLLYAAGTWVAGGSDVITLDTVYDSTLLGQNDYTALFTEEGTLMAKRGNDSRVVTVPICANGATSAGVSIDCDGSEVDLTEGESGTD